MEGRGNTIQTPNYPLNYPVDKACAWVVKTQPGDKVVLTFETFALEDNSVCQYDYVIIRDGSTSKSPMIGKFCGTSRPATITSTHNFLWIGFRSDSSTTKQGFKAVWKASTEEPPPRSMLIHPFYSMKVFVNCRNALIVDFLRKTIKKIYLHWLSEV